MDTPPRHPPSDDPELAAIEAELDALYGPVADPGPLPLLATPSNHPAVQALADLFQDQVDAAVRKIRPAARAPGLSEADLCRLYIDTHQPTVFVHDQFWRQPGPARPWAVVPPDQIEAELLDTLHGRQHDGPAPTRARLRSALALLKLRTATVDPAAWDDSRGFFPLLDLGYPIFGSDHDGHPYDLDWLPYIATTFPFAYDPQADCPVWERFLQTTIPEHAGFVQEFAGYCLTPFTHHELSLWVCGAAHSGKSTFLHGLHTLLGDLAGRLSLPDLARRRLDPAALRGKRLLIADEAPPGFAALPSLPALIDGQPITLAPPHQPPVEVRPHAKLVIAFTGPPSLDGAPYNPSLYRRAAPVLFPPLPPGAVDPTLKDQISQEGPGMFLWARRGLDRLTARGRFDPPATLLALLEQLRRAALGPRDFIAQHCRLDPAARTQSSILHRAYLAYCEQHGLEPLSAKALALQWHNLGFEKGRPGGVSHWLGLQLISTGLAVPRPPAQLPAPNAPSSGNE